MAAPVGKCNKICKPICSAIQIRFEKYFLNKADGQCMESSLGFDLIFLEKKYHTD